MSNIENNRNYFKSFKPVHITDEQIPGSFQSEIIFLSINDTGTRLVTSRTDKTLRIWKCFPSEINSPTIIESPHARGVECISWYPKAEFTFASVGRDDTVKIWKCHGGVLEKEININRDNSNIIKDISCHLVKYSNDGEILMVADRDSVVYFYSVANNYKKVNEIQLEDYVYDLQWFHYNHKFFAAALHNGTVPLYEVKDNEEENQGDDGKVINSIVLRHKLIGHRSSITCLKLDPRGSHLAIGSNEGVVSLWNTSDLLNCKLITQFDEPISYVSFSRDGGYLAIGYDINFNSRIYEVSSLTEVYEIPNSVGGKSVLPAICWFPNKTSFVYSSDGKTTTFLRKAD